MAIDREARDEIAAVLLAYMRGEIGGRAYFDRMSLIVCHERDLWRIHGPLCDLCDGDRAISVSQRGWKSLRRTLAFLKSDLPLKPVSWTVWGRHEKTAALGLAGLLLAACVAALTGTWQIILFVWLGLGLAWPLLIEPWPVSRPDIDERFKAYPFRTEAHWKAYDPLLDGMDIPPYDEGLHHVKTKRQPKPGTSLAQLQDPEIHYGIQYSIGCVLFLPVVLLRDLWPYHTTYFAALREERSA
jgi:hypothetical protein